VDVDVDVDVVPPLLATTSPFPILNRANKISEKIQNLRRRIHTVYHLVPNSIKI